jgi:hypothetical protein
MVSYSNITACLERKEGESERVREEKMPTNWGHHCSKRQGGGNATHGLRVLELRHSPLLGTMWQAVFLQRQ